MRTLVILSKNRNNFAHKKKPRKKFRCISKQIYKTHKKSQADSLQIPISRWTSSQHIKWRAVLTVCYPFKVVRVHSEYLKHSGYFLK